MNEKSVSRIATPRWVYSAVRGLLSTPVLLLALIVAGPSVAAAAEIVDVRMGAHKGYVRLVFQLDAPADYKLERGLGGEAMFVSIQARSGPLEMQSPAPPVDSVTVAPQSLRHPRACRISSEWGPTEGNGFDRSPADRS